jgi:hypothetical protein
MYRFVPNGLFNQKETVVIQDTWSGVVPAYFRFQKRSVHR